MDRKRRVGLSHATPQIIHASASRNDRNDRGCCNDPSCHTAPPKRPRRADDAPVAPAAPIAPVPAAPIVTPIDLLTTTPIDLLAHDPHALYANALAAVAGTPLWPHAKTLLTKHILDARTTLPPNITNTGTALDWYTRAALDACADDDAPIHNRVALARALLRTIIREKHHAQLGPHQVALYTSWIQARWFDNDTDVPRALVALLAQLTSVYTSCACRGKAFCDLGRATALQTILVCHRKRLVPTEDAAKHIGTLLAKIGHRDHAKDPRAIHAHHWADFLTTHAPDFLADILDDFRDLTTQLAAKFAYATHTRALYNTTSSLLVHMPNYIPVPALATLAHHLIDATATKTPNHITGTRPPVDWLRGSLLFLAVHPPPPELRRATALTLARAATRCRLDQLAGILCATTAAFHALGNNPHWRWDTHSNSVTRLALDTLFLRLESLPTHRKHADTLIDTILQISAPIPAEPLDAVSAIEAPAPVPVSVPVSAPTPAVLADDPHFDPHFDPFFQTTLDGHLDPPEYADLLEHPSPIPPPSPPFGIEGLPDILFDDPIFAHLDPLSTH